MVDKKEKISYNQLKNIVNIPKKEKFLKRIYLKKDVFFYMGFLDVEKVYYAKFLLTKHTQNHINYHYQNLKNISHKIFLCIFI